MVLKLHARSTPQFDVLLGCGTWHHIPLVIYCDFRNRIELQRIWAYRIQ